MASSIGYVHVAFDYFLYLFSFPVWPIRLSSVVLPIILSSFYIQSLCFLDILQRLFNDLRSPNNISIRIFPLPTSLLNFFL